MTVPWWVWLATVAGIVALIALDAVQTRRPRHVDLRRAAGWTALYVAVAAAFGAGLYLLGPAGAGGSFFAGYLVEKSLSVDNLLVFAIILDRFAVPAIHRHRVLLIGVIGALVLRAALIVAGAALVERFAVTFVVFGAILLYSGIQLLRSHRGQPDVTEGRAVRLLRRVVPVTGDHHGGDLVVKVDGRRSATPLLVAGTAILSADIVFAMDSIPAIFGVTDSTYLVFTANALALLGLRPLYFVVVGLLDRLAHLTYGLSVVLAVIGVKLILHFAHSVHQSVPEISTPLSLVLVAAVLGVTTLTSLRASRTPPGTATAAKPATRIDSRLEPDPAR